MDPIYKNSPYECFAGNPIWFTDINGADSTVYMFSYQAKNKGTSVDGPGKQITSKILNNVKKIFEANGINNLKYKIIDQKAFMSGKIKLDPSDAVLGIIGSSGMESEGGSYINAGGNTEPSPDPQKFGFPHYSYLAGNDHAAKSNSDPVATTSIAAAHEVWHQYLLKADKVFFGNNSPSSNHFDESYNLNATGYKLGSYLEQNKITSQTLLAHTNENTIGYITAWQRVYVHGYFKAINSGVSTYGNDAGKTSTWKYVFQTSGWLFNTQLRGLKSLRNSMVGNRPND